MQRRPENHAYKQLSEENEPVASVKRARQLQHENRQRRMDRYEIVMEKVRQGLSQREIGRLCGLSRKTVRRWLKAGEFPERKRSLRYSSVEAYSEYLELRWQQGCNNAAQLWRELQARGFAGRPHTLRDWLQKQYGRRQERVQQQTLLPSQPRMSPRKAAGQLLKQPEQAQPFLNEINRRSPQIASLATTAREFCRILRERDSAAWPEWRRNATAGPLAGFAKHHCRDEAAFLAALQQP